MPDDILQPYQDNRGMDSRAVDHCQSVWMAHWMCTRYKSATHPCKYTSIDSESKREVKENNGMEHSNLLRGPDVAIDICTRAEAFRDETKATTVTFVNGSQMEVQKQTDKGSLDFKSFPIFSLSEKREGVLSLKREQHAISHGEILKSQTNPCSGNSNVSFNRRGPYTPSTSAYVPPKTQTLSREFDLPSESSLPADLLMKSPDNTEKNNVADPTSQCDFIKSTSDIVQFGQNKGKSPMPSFPCGKHEIYQSSYNISREHFLSTNYHGHASLSIHEKKTSSFLDHRTSALSRLMRSCPGPLPHDPLVSCDHGLKFVRDQHKKMQDCSGTSKFSRVNFYCRSSSVPQLPCSVHDFETMKIYTTTDSVEESCKGHPKISQKIHHFLMSKETDLSDMGQIFRDPTRLISEIPDFSMPIGYRTLHGVKMEGMGSFMENKEKEKLQDLKTPMNLKNESSAETDTMDINAFQENQLSGDDCDIPSTSNKVIVINPQQSPKSQVAIASARENTKAKSVNSAVPDINQEPPEFPAVTSPADGRETSTSRTQSLDVEHLLSHAEEHANSKSSTCGIGNLWPEPSSRWVKRLKLSTSDSADGTKSAKLGETSCKKVNKIFTKFMKGNKTTSEPKIICLAEEQMVPDPYVTVSTNGKSPCGKTKQTVETTLSHPWIQRWSHSRAASSEKRHEPMEISEPKSSKAVREKFQNKEFPSIAAMALTGKALGNLHPCEFRKKGAVVVWNTRAMQVSPIGNKKSE